MSGRSTVGAQPLMPEMLNSSARRGRLTPGPARAPAPRPHLARDAGAVRATPHDLLTFLEAHLNPAAAPPAPAPALRAVRVPVLRRGLTHRHVHTVAWFRHPTDGGPMYFHSGATLGQRAFLGFRPDTGTALAAVCTRRFRAHDPFLATAYALLAEERLDPPGADGTGRAGTGQP